MFESKGKTIDEDLTNKVEGVFRALSEAIAVSFNGLTEMAVQDGKLKRENEPVARVTKDTLLILEYPDGREVVWAPVGMSDPVTGMVLKADQKISYE